MRLQDCGPDDRCCIFPRSRRDPQGRAAHSSHGDVRRRPAAESLPSNGSSCIADAAARNKCGKECSIALGRRPGSILRGWCRRHRERQPEPAADGGNSDQDGDRMGDGSVRSFIRPPSSGWADAGPVFRSPQTGHWRWPARRRELRALRFRRTSRCSPRCRFRSPGTRSCASRGKC